MNECDNDTHLPPTEQLPIKKVDALQLDEENADQDDGLKSSMAMLKKQEAIKINEAVAKLKEGKNDFELAIMTGDYDKAIDHLMGKSVGVSLGSSFNKYMIPSLGVSTGFIPYLKWILHDSKAVQNLSKQEKDSFHSKLADKIDTLTKKIESDGNKITVTSGITANASVFNEHVGVSLSTEKHFNHTDLNAGSGVMKGKLLLDIDVTIGVGIITTKMELRRLKRVQKMLLNKKSGNKDQV